MAAITDKRQARQLALELARVDVYKGDMQRQGKSVDFADSFSRTVTRLQQTFPQGWDKANLCKVSRIQKDVEGILAVAKKAGIGLKREQIPPPKNPLLSVEKPVVDLPPLAKVAEQVVQQSLKTSEPGYEMVDASDGEVSVYLSELLPETDYEFLEAPPPPEELEKSDSRSS